MADIEIAIRAKNEASSAISQTNADLASLARTAGTTSAALANIGGVSQGLTGASVTIQTVTADLARMAQEARTTGAALGAATQGDTGGAQAVNAAIGSVRAQLADLRNDAQAVLQAGIFGDGTAASKAVANIVNQTRLLQGDLTQLSAAAAGAGRAGILGDGATPSAQLNQVSQTVAKLRADLNTISTGDKGVAVTVTAKDNAGPVLKQLQAELAQTAQTATQTSTVLDGVGTTMAGTQQATAALNALTTQLRAVTTQAETLNQVTTAPAKLENAGAAEAISAGIKAARAEADGLLRTYEQLAAAGKLEFGAGTAANLAQARIEIGKELAAVNALDAASKAAAKAGVLGDGATISRELAQITTGTQRLTAGLRNVEQGAKQAATSVRSSIGGIDQVFGKVGGLLTGGLGGIAGAVGLGAAAVAVGQIASAVNEAVLAAERVDKLRVSFDNLAQSAGQSGDQMLKSLRGASRGMISDSDLILSANKAMLLGVADSSEELGSLLEIARARGQAMGLSLAEAFDQITIGIGRLSPRILDNLGIVIDQKAAFDDFAETLNKTAQQLTENERRQALLNATIQQSRSLVSGGGAGAATASAQAQAAQANLQVEAGRFFAPGERDALQAQLDIIARLTGNYDELAVALREINDLQVDSKSDSPLGFKIDPAQLANAKQLGDAITLLNQARAAGVSGLDDYAAALTKIDAETVHGINMTQQQASAVASGIVMLRGEIAAHNAKVEAMRKANDEMARSSPYYSQIVGAAQEAASAEFRASDEAQKLASSFGFAGAMALAASDNIDELKAALNRIEARDAVSGQIEQARQSAISQAQANAQRAVNAGADRNTVAQDLANIVGAINALEAPTTVNTKNMFLFDQQLQAIDNDLESTTNSLDEQNRLAKKLAEEGLQAVKQQFEDIKSKVSGVISESQKLPDFKAHMLYTPEELKKFGLTGDSSVSVDKAVELSANRPDAINENARRLQAIAVEGLKDQLWLEEFKREVPGVFKELQESPDIKAAAFNILKQFEAGMRPELLDKGQIKERVKDMIIGERNATALAQEIAQEIAGEMGISLQQALGAANTALGVGTGTEGGATGVTAPDLTAQGTTSGQTFRGGFVAGFDATGMTGEILAKVDAEFSNPKSWLALNKSGSAVGAVWAGGFVAGASKETSSGVYEFFAAGLLPYVVAALAGQGSRTGAQP